MSLPFLPIASERSPSRRPRECRPPPPTRGFPTKTQAASSNHLGSSGLDHPASLVVRLARSAALCSGGHGHPLAARTVSQVLGPIVQLSSRATRPARYGLADSPIDRANGDGQSIVACATDSWRIEHAGHRDLRTHRLAHSAPASPACPSPKTDPIGSPAQSEP